MKLRIGSEEVQVVTESESARSVEDFDGAEGASELRWASKGLVDEFANTYRISKGQAKALLARVLTSECIRDQIYPQADFLVGIGE